jgi:sensor domain CHASE-containing protein
MKVLVTYLDYRFERRDRNQIDVRRDGSDDIVASAASWDEIFKWLDQAEPETTHADVPSRDK